MKFPFLSPVYLLTIGLTIGCGKSNQEYQQLESERDSLRTAMQMSNSKLDNYSETLNLMTSTLDSIAYQEDIVFVGKGDLEPTREDVKSNLQRFETLIKEQHDKIVQLEKKLANSKEENATSLRLIEHLKSQIAVKDAQIAQLNEALEKKNVSIAKLEEIVKSQNLRIESQEVTISNLNKRTEKQNAALAAQDAILNNGYVLIGTKSDLTRKGVTKRGKLVTDAILDRTKFYKVDIRKWREINFTAKRPKILTNMPSTAYELTTTGKRNFTLKVTNPSEFWRISSYLVIQTD